MSKHILDHSPRARSEAPALLRYARASRAGHSALEDRFLRLRRRARGPFNPAARMQAFLRIERGYRA